MIGRTIDNKYRLDAVLGAGGMGIVYRATRLLIGDAVAIKILHPELVKDAQAAERFRREAQAAARLKHPNVVMVYDFGVTEDGLVYLVMELVEGESLRLVIKRNGALPLDISAEITRQVCTALDEAHESNSVHRDMKSDNIVVRETPHGLRVKVLDFGIARLLDVSTGTNNLTQTGTVTGTPFYMSPEQCLGEEVDYRADIYSVGIILYEMLTGALPFNSPTPTAVAVQHATRRPSSLRAINMSIPPEVESVVMHALEKRREARPQSAGALAHELTDAISEVAFIRRVASGVLPDHTTQLSPPSLRATAETIPTMVMTNPVRQSGAVPPVGLTNSRMAIPPPAKSSRNVLLLCGSILLGVLITGALLWIQSNDGKDQAKNASIAVSQNTGTETAKANVDERQKQKNDGVASNSLPTISRPPSAPAINTPGTESPGVAQSGSWFVVLGSYPKTERYKANERLSYLKGSGYDAYIVDTDSYPNLKGGLWSVVMGPYSKNYAKEMMDNLRPLVPDIYIK